MPGMSFETEVSIVDLPDLDIRSPPTCPFTLTLTLTSVLGRESPMSSSDATKTAGNDSPVVVVDTIDDW
jgi:hypothetical protein